MYKPQMEDKMAKVTIINKSSSMQNGVKPGGKTQIEVDKDGTPFELYWRRRFSDAKIDGCVEIIKEEVKKKFKPKEDKK